MKQWFKALLVLLVIVYPFAVYFGLHYFSPRNIALSLAFLFLLRFILLQPRSINFSQAIVILLTLLGLGISFLGAISNNEFVMKLYPAAVSLLLFGFFFYSLLSPPTVIQHIAQLKMPKLSNEAIRYTRKVTIVWCVFFVLNGSVALVTALFAPTKIWAIYNGFVAYLLIGLVFVIEFIVRQYCQRHFDKHKIEAR